MAKAHKAIFYTTEEGMKLIAWDRKGKVVLDNLLSHEQMVEFGNQAMHKIVKLGKDKGFWQGFGITMTIGALIFAKKWTKERLRADKLEQEAFDAEIEKAFDELDGNDIFKEEDDGSSAS